MKGEIGYSCINVDYFIIMLSRNKFSVDSGLKYVYLFLFNIFCFSMALFSVFESLITSNL